VILKPVDRLLIVKKPFPPTYRDPVSIGEVLEAPFSAPDLLGGMEPVGVVFDPDVLEAPGLGVISMLAGIPVKLDRDTGGTGTVPPALTVPQTYESLPGSGRIFPVERFARDGKDG
jgi:hypothetical protein